LGRQTNGTFQRLSLGWVDETALVLAGAATMRGKALDLVYPAPAGEVSTLLAAQLLIHALAGERRNPSVGLVTADPAAATRVWDELRIESQGSRVPLWEVFPAYRADPDGTAQFTGALRGVVIGRRCDGWIVDVTVVDSLAGPVVANPRGPVIRVFADPLDPSLDDAKARGELIWGWSEGHLALGSAPASPVQSNRVPFSVAQGRLDVLREGVRLDVTVCTHADAEQRLGEAREALLRLSRLVGAAPSRHLEMGIRVTWSHLTTLACLPCRPSEYDKFAGVPPRAARAASEFEREVAAWARTLPADMRDLAQEVSAQIGLLVAALERGNPFGSALAHLALEGKPMWIVTRTRTAARALVAAQKGDERALRVGPLRVTWYGALHQCEVLPRAVVVGPPARSGWHRIAAGIAPDLGVLVLGELEADRARWAWDALRAARHRWGSQDLRRDAWSRLFVNPPPPPYPEPQLGAPVFNLSVGTRVMTEPDPFSPLGSLLRDDRMLLADEGSQERLVEVGERGDLRTHVSAVEIDTDFGFVLLPAEREVDVVVADTLERVVASSLSRGSRLVIAREGGRIGLIEALEDRLQHRPDLLASRLLIDEYQTRVYAAFRDSELTAPDLYQRMKSLSCTKSSTAVRSWVTRGGPMGPRDLEDIPRLNSALHLGYQYQRLREIHAGLEQVRVFRRVAGLALVRATTAALLARDDARVSAELGLSVADLRDAVAIATVRGLRLLPRLATITEIGHLQEVPFQ